MGEAYFTDRLVYRAITPRLGQHILAAIERVHDRLVRLSVPTLVIHGEVDELVPVQSSAILADLPGVERRVYPGLRHECHQEPEAPQVISGVIGWLRRQPMPEHR